MNSPIEEDELKRLRKDFFMFIDEYDIRRKLNFVDTFPELKEFYKICKET